MMTSCGTINASHHSMTDEIYELKINESTYIIDLKHKDKVLSYKWTEIHGYAVTCLYDSTQMGSHYGYYGVTINYPLAHLILGLPPQSGKLVDHKDLNKKNNKEDNIRVCNDSQNKYNRPKTNVKCISIHKGVTFHKTRNYFVTAVALYGARFYVYKHINNQDYCGYAYNFAIKIIAGEFARFNEVSLTPEEKLQVESAVMKKLKHYASIDTILKSKMLELKLL